MRGELLLLGGLRQVYLDDPPGTSRCYASAIVIEKPRRPRFDLSFARSDFLGPFLKVILQSLPRFGTQRYYPVFAALAEDSYQSVFEEEVLNIQPYQLGEAQTTG